MDYVISAMGMPFNGATLATLSLGGSETAAYYLARELARRGHRVSVFTAHPEGGTWDGVTYVPAGNMTQAAPLGEQFEFYCRSTPHDVLIIQRHPLALHRQYQAKVVIHQHHDIALFRYGPMITGGLWQADIITGVSQWHCDQMRSVYGMPERIQRAVPNGVDPVLYLEPFEPHPAVQGARVENDCFALLYQSRPERGFMHLVRPGGIMDKLRGTRAHLFYCGYDNITGPMVEFYAQLNTWADALPNVTNLGALTKAELARLQRSCDALIYPTEFEEVSCITAMEAMHAGLPFLSSAHAALPETCKDSGSVLLPLKDGTADEDAFVARVTEWLADDSALSALRERQLTAARSRTWSHAADELLAVIADVMQENRSPAAVLRHAIAHSDIGFAGWYAQQTTTEQRNIITDHAEAELAKMYAFAEDPQLYRLHYARHQARYYAEHGEKVLGEDVTGSTRFRGVASALYAALKDAPPGARVLDYGCAHGHYLIPLAKAFPQAEFHGVDISEQAIGTALRWAVRDKLTNVTLTIGDEAELTPANTLLCPVVAREYEHMEESINADGTISVAPAVDIETRTELFDVVLAGEILEHVHDYRGLLERFRSVLKPGGTLIVTTPCGRWEHSGTDEFRKAREHLHHFERADILEICAGHRVDLAYAPAGHDRAGGQLGSWIWCVRFSDEPIGQVDYARKHREMRPRQTVSACLIVKDGEGSLRRCIVSFIDQVDELVIGIDPATTDRTEDVLRALRKDYPLVPLTAFTLPWPVLEAGFDRARNETIDRACGDWILWLDADEEVRQPWNIWPWLRVAGVDAFSLPQVHYSVDPQQVLTTDHPCRLFRRSSGARFYGICHEHPEVEMGKAIPYTVMRSDVQFLHAGYVDEETRRKRYMRNLPLLHRDAKENSKRGLVRFLMLRDIAQGIAFDQEWRGQAIPDHAVQAQRGIRLYEEMLESSESLRMVIDAVQFYSACVTASGQRAFDAEFSIKTVNPTAPDLSCSTQVSAKFCSTAHYKRLLQRISEEAIAKYDDKYL